MENFYLIQSNILLTLIYFFCELWRSYFSLFYLLYFSFLVDEGLKGVKMCSYCVLFRLLSVIWIDCDGIFVRCWLGECWLGPWDVDWDCKIFHRVSWMFTGTFWNADWEYYFSTGFIMCLLGLQTLKLLTGSLECYLGI